MADLVAKVADGGGRGSMAEKVANQLIKSPVGRKLLDLGEKVTNGAGKFRPYGRIKATDKVARVATNAQWALGSCVQAASARPAIVALTKDSRSIA